MVSLELKGYEEEDIINKVVSGLRHDILSQKKYWGKVESEGHYSDFDKFKNQIAELVAEKIYQDIVNSGEVAKRIELACKKAEVIVNNRFNMELKPCELREYLQK